MEIAVFLIGSLVFFGFAGYVFLMIYYPEWVGITGKAAHKTMQEHREGSSADDSDFFEKK